MGIEKTVGAEIEEPADQPMESGVGRRLDRRRHAAEEGRQRVRAQRHAGDHAEAAATTTFEGPQQVGVRASIGDPHKAVGRDDFRLQQTCR